MLGSKSSSVNKVNKISALLVFRRWSNRGEIQFSDNLTNKQCADHCDQVIKVGIQGNITQVSQGRCKLSFKANFKQRGHRPQEERKEAVPALVSIQCPKGLHAYENQKETQCD